jgi:hypothetical protein
MPARAVAWLVRSRASDLLKLNLLVINSDWHPNSHVALNTWLTVIGAPGAPAHCVVPRARCSGPLFAVCCSAEPAPRSTPAPTDPAPPLDERPRKAPVERRTTPLRSAPCCAAPGARERGCTPSFPGRAATDRSSRSAAAQNRGLRSAPAPTDPASPLDERPRKAPVQRRITALRFAALRAAPRPGHGNRGATPS